MFNCRSRTRSAFQDLFRSPFIWAAVALVAGLQILAIYLTPLASLLQTVRLTATDWMIVAAAFIAPVIIMEVVKTFLRRRRDV
jgi:Ca2+-transporting ATPase